MLLLYTVHYSETNIQDTQDIVIAVTNVISSK